MIVLNEIISQLGKIPEEPWVRDEPTSKDLEDIANETKYSEFDPHDLRKKMLEDLRAGVAKLVTRRNSRAKILAIVYPEAEPEPTLRLFSRILAAFGGKTHGFTRIIWFAHPMKREFPTEGPLNISENSAEAEATAEAVPSSGHINGGYTFPCTLDTIVLYREEEAARVLVHELLHAHCTDDMQNPVWMREVLTETWAELFLIGILANGSQRKGAALWKIQAQWIANQQAELERRGVLSPEHYAWRYTVGRESILHKLGIFLPVAEANPIIALGNSLRFTSPSLY